MTIRTTDEGSGKEIRYEPFIERGPKGDYEIAGFTIEVEGRQRKVYLMTCDNEPLIWLHSDLPESEEEPITFVTASELLEE